MYVVANSPECLRLRESSRLVSTVLAGAAVALGIFAVSRHFDRTLLINTGIAAVAAVFFRRESRVTLDKPARRCGIWRRDMWRTSYRAIAFDDITDVRVEIERPDTGRQTHSRLAVVTRDGAVPLTAGFGPGLDDQIRIREAMVDMIFAGRGRPAVIDPVQLLLDAGQPFAAERRA